jgi:uncharacterized repeat protein (TIGR03803 family)
MASTAHSGWVWRVLALVFFLASAIVPTQAQKFKVLHTFHGADGAYPLGALIRDAAGNIYGTTGEGGSGCRDYGCGTAFKLNKNGAQIWLHEFDGRDGAAPSAGLLRGSSGDLFGTTIYGGIKNQQACAGACGTVFELDGTGKKETVLHKFAGPPDGYFPEAPLVEDKDGNLYGTTYEGGADVQGTVFKIDTAGKEIILHSFTGPPDGGGDGAFPYPGVIRDAAGNLYGVTDAGGAYGAGAVYEVSSSGVETLLYSFSGGDGAQPDSILLLDSGGNLYGTTANGGNDQCGGTGCGVVFKLSPQSGGGWTETVLYDFCSLTACADGEEPVGGPVMDAAGNLYGTTYSGGAADDGAVFKLDTTGKEAVLYSFTGKTDGSLPSGEVTMDTLGNLYGVTSRGGDLTCRPGEYGGCGVVFKITP